MPEIKTAKKPGLAKSSPGAQASKAEQSAASAPVAAAVGKSKKKVVDNTPDTDDIGVLYAHFESQSSERGQAGVSADEIREFTEDLFTKTSKDRLLLSAVVHAMSKKTGKEVQNGTVRSAVQTKFTLEKDDHDRVWIVK